MQKLFLTTADIGAAVPNWTSFVELPARSMNEAVSGLKLSTATVDSGFHPNVGHLYVSNLKDIFQVVQKPLQTPESHLQLSQPSCEWNARSPRVIYRVYKPNANIIRTERF